jgi:chromate reductase, NAD(P)H dehydrogenase (quinone)
VKILGLSGSLRQGSHNTSLLRAAARALPAGAELEVFDGLRDLPLYDEDLDVEPAPEPVARLRDAITTADGLLIATPEHNGTMPAALKNAIDWASRPFPGNPLKGKPIAVVGASTGLFGAVWAQADVRKSLGVAGADVLENELPVGQAHVAITDAGELADPDLSSALDELLGILNARGGAALSQAA